MRKSSVNKLGEDNITSALQSKGITKVPGTGNEDNVLVNTQTGPIAVMPGELLVPSNTAPISVLDSINYDSKIPKFKYQHND